MDYLYYHGEKGQSGNVRQVALITDADNIDITYDCIIYWQNLNCEPENCEIYKDTDDVWKVRIKEES